MGFLSSFFSWLFGIEKKEHQQFDDVPADPMIEEKKEEILPKRTKYQKVPRSRESNAFVNSMVKKAESQDYKPTPYQGHLDNSQSAENFVKKIQGRK